jgi:hypothetical protein
VEEGCAELRVIAQETLAAQQLLWRHRVRGTLIYATSRIALAYGRRGRRFFAVVAATPTVAAAAREFTTTAVAARTILLAAAFAIILAAAFAIGAATAAAVTPTALAVASRVRFAFRHCFKVEVGISVEPQTRIPSITYSKIVALYM